MPWCQVKHHLLCPSMRRFGGSRCCKQPWLFAAHQGLGFQWGQGELDTDGEPDACLVVTSLLAKMLLFLGWAEFCQLLSSVKFLDFAEAKGDQGDGNTSTLPRTGWKGSHLCDGVVFSQVLCWCIFHIPCRSVSLPAGGKYVQTDLTDCHPSIFPQ